MELLLNQFSHLPHSVPEEQLAALLKGQDLLAFILDRNVALLPAYFAYHQISRNYSDKSRPPHQLLQVAIAPLRSSMQQLADVVGGCV